MATPEILALMKEKRAKLAEQKKLSDDMHTLLAGDEKSGAIGAIESSRLTCKNLEAAIVASRRPGYFSYYAAPKEVQKMEQGKELKKITAAIAKVEADHRTVRDRLCRDQVQGPDRRPAGNGCRGNGRRRGLHPFQVFFRAG